MRGVRKTVYLPKDIAATLTAHAGGNLSGVLSIKLRRYEEILAKSKPAFTPAEWEFLRRVLFNFPAERCEHLRGIAGFVKNWSPPEGEGRPTGVDPSMLAYRIESLGIAQLVALMEDIEHGPHHDRLKNEQSRKPNAPTARSNDIS